MESPPLDWSPTEKALWGAFCRGEQLDVRPADPTQSDPFDNNQWDSSRDIRAEVLHHLLLSDAVTNEGYPCRLILIGARVTGTLDLGCGKVNPFLFTSCRFDEVSNLNDATGSFAGFGECKLPGLSAERFDCSGAVWLQGTRAHGTLNFENCACIEFDARFLEFVGSNDGYLNLNGSRVGRDINLHGTSAPCVSLTQASLEGDLLLGKATLGKGGLRAFQATIGGSAYLTDGFASEGPTYLEGVTIGGKCVINEGKFTADEQSALHLDHAEIRLGFQGRNAEVNGTFRAHHAKIGCQLSLQDAKLRNPGDVALQADHILIDGSLLLNGDTIVEGAIDLHGAEIECTLNLVGASFIEQSNSMPALSVRNVRIGGNVLGHSLSMKGQVALDSSTISGAVDLTEASIQNRRGRVSLSATKATISKLMLSSNFSSIGEIRLADSTIETDLVLSGATLDNAESTSLRAPRLAVQGNILASDCKAIGSIELTDATVNGDVRLLDSSLKGLPLKEPSFGRPRDPNSGREWRGISINLSDAEISGDVDVRGSAFTESIVLESARIGGAVILDQASVETSSTVSLRAEGLTAGSLRMDFKRRPQGMIDLTSASVKLLADSDNSWPDSGLKIEGFEYRRLSSSMSTRDRIAWLRGATNPYAAQPYSQLASCFSLAGQEDDAREVRFASDKRYHQTGNLTLRFWGRLQEWTVGFGYKPARALLIFSLLWVSASLWFSFGVASCGRESAGLCPVKAGEHPTWDPWLYSLDLLVPLVNLGHEIAWDPTGWSKLVMYVLTVSGWILATTVIAAASRKLRRT
ncbi:hypothetical protein [Saccharopolyspora taberi]|uniref:Oxidoreductase n=1 Tax=Saccharopolyspora taberi TaxID=60895 RepID=A0ABN3VD83_9PSEU